MSKKYTAKELAGLCRVAVMADYSEGVTAFVAMFPAPAQAEAFARAKRLEQGDAADPEWRVERL